LLSKWLEKLPIGFSTVMTTHTSYDVYFDKLCDLLINRDKFDMDILEDNGFTKCIIEIKLYLKGVRHWQMMCHPWTQRTCRVGTCQELRFLPFHFLSYKTPKPNTKSTNTLFNSNYKFPSHSQFCLPNFAKSKCETKSLGAVFPCFPPLVSHVWPETP
jgi:hypothetical protein